MQNYTVYKHIAPNGKIYIGVTNRKPKYRWRGGRGYEKNEYFYRAINKYGWDNIEHVILYEGLAEKEALQKERELISRYKSNDGRYGYNLTTGGEYCTINEETKEKIRQAMAGSGNPMYGRKHTEASRYKMGLAQKGMKHTEETKKRMSEAQKGEKGHNYGKHLSEETKKKIRDTKSKTKTYPYGMSGEKHHSSIKINQYDKNGNLIKAWGSIREAEKNLDINRSCIIRCCKGRQKLAGGYAWEYSEAQA